MGMTKTNIITIQVGKHFSEELQVFCGSSFFVFFKKTLDKQYYAMYNIVCKGVLIWTHS